MEDLKESLGKTLHSARKAAGLSVDDAVYIGKIPRDVVKALEAEDFGFFNSPLYARSFLQQYGDYVGVDVDLWLDDIEPTAMIDGDDLESLIDLSGPAVGVPLQEKPKRKKSGGSSSMAVVWLVLLTGGLIYGGIKAYDVLDARFAPAPTPSEETKTAAKTPEPEAEEPAKPEPVVVKPAIRAEPEAPRRAILVEEPPEE